MVGKQIYDSFLLFSLHLQLSVLPTEQFLKYAQQELVSWFGAFWKSLQLIHEQAVTDKFLEKVLFGEPYSGPARKRDW
jgi:hypothetical protein